MTETKTKTLLLEMRGGTQKRITVPAKAKVTFGAIVPSAKSYDPSGGWALRLYLGKEQIAVFCGVTEFRELGPITIIEKRVETKRRNIGQDGPKGFKNAIVEAKVERWVDPDNEDDDIGGQGDELLALAEGNSDAWEI